MRLAFRVGPGGIPARVTLWDELAPPSPLPVPADAARAAQGDAANHPAR